MWVVPREDTYNPLVPFGMRGFFYALALLMNIVYFYNLLIGAEGAKTPVGVWFRGDPAGASAEEARRNTQRKRSSWSGNQQDSLQSLFFTRRKQT
jgi:hypothetical protein